MLEQDQKSLVSSIQGDPVAMWKKLADTYMVQKAGAGFNAYDDLFSIRKKEDESLQALISRTDEQMRLCQNLQPADFSLDDWDKELTSMVLVRALPDEYSNFVSSLLVLDKLDKESITQAFLTEEILLKVT